MALYKRGGTWWMNFWFDGHHVQRSTRCKSKRDADTVEKAYYTQLAKGEVGIEPKRKAPNFGDAITDFLAWSKVEHAAKPNTYIRYKTSTEPLKRFFGDTRLDRFSSYEVEKHKVWRSKQTCRPRGKKAKNPDKTTKAKTKSKLLAPATVNRELACLKKIINRLVRQDILTTNPVSKVKFFNEDNLQTRSLSYSEEKLYLMACSQPLQDFAVLMLDTGMRPEEIRNLKVSDVDLTKRYLEIRKGKTKSAQRRIPLTGRAFEILETRLRNHKSEFVFPGQRAAKDKDVPIVKLNSAHYGALRRSGVVKFRLYDLRHTFATRQAEAGTDLVTLASLLGHSRLEMVMRYAHPSKNHKIEAMKRMEAKRANSAPSVTSRKRLEIIDFT
jgi:integrase